MSDRELEREIDALYQLPPGEFTAARNALARRAGSAGAAIKRLAKPAVPAWAVNQLYWQRRPAWDALVSAANEARRAHKSVLAGRGADIRSAGKVHEDAVDAALKQTLSLLSANGQPATDATRHAIATTLRALPGDEAPGRLTRPLEPRGFEALAGLPIAAGPFKKAVPAPAPAPAARKTQPQPQRDERAIARARAAVASAERDVRSAEYALKREEFEIAKAAREERRAEEELAQWRKRHEDAVSRAGTAKTSLAKAKETAERAAAELDRLENDR